MRSPTTSPRPPTSGDGVRERPVRGYRRRRLHPGDEVSIPAAVSRFPREIIPFRAAGPSAPTPTSCTSTDSRRAVTSPPGNNRNSLRARCERRSGRRADRCTSAAAAVISACFGATSKFEVIPIDTTLFRRGLDHHRAPEKEWSLTDRVSMLVMIDRGLVGVATRGQIALSRCLTSDTAAI
jgi:hypothetical protein